LSLSIKIFYFTRPSCREGLKSILEEGEHNSVKPDCRTLDVACLDKNFLLCRKIIGKLHLQVNENQSHELIMGIIPCKCRRCSTNKYYSTMLVEAGRKLKKAIYSDATSCSGIIFGFHSSDRQDSVHFVFED
jgi:hypothetical protein